jgi:hypothetical protein
VENEMDETRKKRKIHIKFWLEPPEGKINFRDLEAEK